MRIQGGRGRRRALVAPVAGQGVAPELNRRLAETGPAPRDRPSMGWLSLALAPCAWSLEPMERRMD